MAIVHKHINLMKIEWNVEGNQEPGISKPTGRDLAMLC
jgi:hypothetical protein